MLDELQPVSGAGGRSFVDAGSLMQLHVAPSRTLWRVGPAWAVLAGALAGGASPGNAESLLRLAAAAILADLLWGILRRIISDSPQSAGTAILIAPSLPYSQGNAPLARFLQTIAADQGSVANSWLGWVGGLVLTAGLSLLLGIPALLISAGAVGLIFLARALLLSGRLPALNLALLDVALPWLLGALLVFPGVDSEARHWLWQIGMLAVAFTVLQWGVYRARFSAGQRMFGLWLGQVLLLATLIALRQPWAVAVAALMLAPPTWWLTRREGAASALACSLPWWWASMLSVAAIMR